MKVSTREEQIKDFLVVLTEIDQMKAEVRQRELEAHEIREALKTVIEMDNEHLIGKAAMCVIDNIKGPVQCICNAVKVTNDFNIKPLFQLNRKNISVEYYDWI